MKISLCMIIVIFLIANYSINCLSKRKHFRKGNESSSSTKESKVPNTELVVEIAEFSEKLKYLENKANKTSIEQTEIKQLKNKIEQIKKKHIQDVTGLHF